jgi:hypothetical protein
MIPMFLNFCKGMLLGIIDNLLKAGLISDVFIFNTFTVRILTIDLIRRHAKKHRFRPDQSSNTLSGGFTLEKR